GDAERGERLGRALGARTVVEETVEGRPGAAHVGAEGARREQLARERRRGEVVQGQGGEVARRARPDERAMQRPAAVVEPGGSAVAAVDGGGGLLPRTVREQEQHGVVL